MNTNLYISLLNFHVSFLSFHYFHTFVTITFVFVCILYLFEFLKAIMPNEIDKMSVHVHSILSDIILNVFILFLFMFPFKLFIFMHNLSNFLALYDYFLFLISFLSMCWNELLLIVPIILF